VNYLKKWHLPNLEIKFYASLDVPAAHVKTE